MKLKSGDLFESGADVIVFTGNSTVRKDRCLVMGRGAAHQAKQLFPGCDEIFGKEIITKPLYGVVVHPFNLRPILAVFQVKHHYKAPAELSLIKHSTAILKVLASGVWKDLCIAMNFPGIGWGRLNREEVLPIISELPDNVEVWEKDNAT